MINKLLCYLFDHKPNIIFLENPNKIDYPKILAPVCTRCKKEMNATFGEIKKWKSYYKK